MSGIGNTSIQIATVKNVGYRRRYYRRYGYPAPYAYYPPAYGYYVPPAAYAYPPAIGYALRLRKATMATMAALRLWKATTASMADAPPVEGDYGDYGGAPPPEGDYADAPPPENY